MKTTNQYPTTCPYCGSKNILISRHFAPFAPNTPLVQCADCGRNIDAKLNIEKIVDEELHPTIKIVYHDPEMPKIVAVDGKSDWFDLRAAETVDLKAGEYKLISLGVSMKLPDGYEAHIVPRSSTFKQFGVLQTNHFGVMDSSFSGNGDIWRFPAYAMRDTTINKYDRICQFRIQEKQPTIQFAEVSQLDDTDRGGIGSTGRN